MLSRNIISASTVGWMAWDGVFWGMGVEPQSNEPRCPGAYRVDNLRFTEI